MRSLSPSVLRAISNYQLRLRQPPTDSARLRDFVGATRAHEIEAKCTARIKISYRMPRHSLTTRSPLASLTDTHARVSHTFVFFL